MKESVWGSHLNGLLASASHELPDRECVFPVPPEDIWGIVPARTCKHSMIVFWPLTCSAL